MFTNIGVTFHLLTTEQKNPCWHIEKQIAIGDVIDIIGIFPSSEYRRVYFSFALRSRLFLCQILKFLLTTRVNNLSRRTKHVSFFCRKQTHFRFNIYFFIFAIIVARWNQMEEDYLLGAGYTFCFIITSFFVKVSIHGITAP